MSHLFRGTALLALVAANPALADITPKDAWAMWEAQIKAFNIPHTADVSEDGDALVINALTFSITLPENEGQFAISMGGPRLEPTGDGTVRVTYPGPMSLKMNGESRKEGSFEAELEASFSGLSAIMSGTPEKITSDWTTGRMDMKFVSLTIDGKPLEDIEGHFTVTGGKGLTVSEMIGDTLKVEGTSSMEAYDLAYKITIPEGEQSITVDAGGRATGIASKVSALLPQEGIAWLGAHEQLRGNRLSLAVESQVAQTESWQKMDGGPQVNSDQRTVAEKYDIAARIDPAGLSYGGTVGAFSTTIDVAGVPMPMPIEISAQEADFALAFPLLKSEMAQDAKLRLSLSKLNAGDGVWNMIDAQGKLPREPFDLTIDAAGKVNLLIDPLDIETLAKNGPPPGAPVLPESVTLNMLSINGLGAMGEAMGAFTFDANDWQTWPGMPAPDGNLSVKIEGLSKLFANLVDAGLMRQEDTMGAQMMLGMFAKPGEGEDTLVSEIEVKKTGEVLANGQRLK